jgi:hypothetical protein
MGLTALAQSRAIQSNGRASMVDEFETEGRRHLLDAMQTAREQQAPMLELRAVLDFADYLIERAETARAASLLAEISKQIDMRSNAPDIRRLVCLLHEVTQPALPSHASDSDSGSGSDSDSDSGKPAMANGR